MHACIVLQGRRERFAPAIHLPPVAARHESTANDLERTPLIGQPASFGLLTFSQIIHLQFTRFLRSDKYIALPARATTQFRILKNLKEERNV
jgi:hypothetical protein